MPSHENPVLSTTDITTHPDGDAPAHTHLTSLEGDGFNKFGTWIALLAGVVLILGSLLLLSILHRKGIIFNSWYRRRPSHAQPWRDWGVRAGRARLPSLFDLLHSSKAPGPTDLEPESPEPRVPATDEECGGSQMTKNRASVCFIEPPLSASLPESSTATSPVASPPSTSPPASPPSTSPPASPPSTSPSASPPSTSPSAPSPIRARPTLQPLRSIPEQTSL